VDINFSVELNTRTATDAGSLVYPQFLEAVFLETL